MNKFRSSRKVEQIANILHAKLSAESKSIWGIGYTFDKQGCLILIYHGRLSKKVEKISTWYGYRVQWVPGKKSDSI